MGSRRRPEHVETARHRRVKTLFIQIVAVFAQVMAGGLVLAQVLTHGPVVGGVTSSKASVFLRSDQEASVALCYGTIRISNTCQMSETYQTRSARDFTKIIRPSGLIPDCMSPLRCYLLL
jgi:hypothetical protein